MTSLAYPAQRAPRSAPRMSWLLPAALACAGALPPAYAAIAPREGRPVAAIFPPWWSQARAAAAGATAGAAILRMGAWRTVVVLRATQPGLLSRLNAAGAWLILAADPVRPCQPPTPRI